MLLDDLRPILSGLAGGAIAVWLSHRLSRLIPATLNGKSAQQLTREHRAAVRLANIASFAGLLGALALYQWGEFSRNDWRPLGLGFGFALAAPLAILPIVALLRRQSVRECMVSWPWPLSPGVGCRTETSGLTSACSRRRPVRF